MRTEVLRNEQLLRFIQLQPTAILPPEKLEMRICENLWVLFCDKVKIYTNVKYCISFKIDENQECYREKSHHACN